MTISKDNNVLANEGVNLDFVVYTKDKRKVTYYDVSLDENELKRILTEITIAYGELKTRQKYDENFEEAEAVKKPIREKHITIPKAAAKAAAEAEKANKLKAHPEDEQKINEEYKEIFSTIERRYNENQKYVAAEFAAFAKKHENERVIHVVSEKKAKKDTTYPTGSIVLLEDGITVGYKLTEIEPMEVNSNTIDPTNQITTKIELADATYRTLLYPPMAKAIVKTLQDLSNVGELDSVALENFNGEEYLDSILSAITLEPCFEESLYDHSERLRLDTDLSKKLEGRRITKESMLFDKSRRKDRGRSKKSTA